MAGGRYEELSGILGTSSSAGSVGKISIGALNSAVNAIVPNLNSEVEKANGLKDKIFVYKIKTLVIILNVNDSKISGEYNQRILKLLKVFTTI